MDRWIAGLVKLDDWSIVSTVRLRLVRGALDVLDAHLNIFLGIWNYFQLADFSQIERIVTSEENHSIQKVELFLNGHPDTPIALRYAKCSQVDQ